MSGKNLLLLTLSLPGQSNETFQIDHTVLLIHGSAKHRSAI